MTKCNAYVRMAVAHAKAMEDNNKFAATLEQCLRDISCSDEINKIRKDVRQLKLSLKLAQE
ncbi:unnamed protein product, partial [Brassica rapa subsp. trilocularis]